MLAKQISALLSQEDAVVVPELGRFYSKYEGSNLKGSELLPPSRVVMFENHPKVDPADTLKKYVQQAENLSDEAWEERINAFVKGIEAEVNINGRYDLVTLGTFSKGIDDSLEFESVNSLNQAPDSFGLPPLSLKPVVASKRSETIATPVAAAQPDPEPTTEASEAAEQPTTYTRDDLRKKKTRSNNSLITWGVTIPLVIALAFFLWLFFKSSSTPSIRNEELAEVEEPLEELPAELPEEDVEPAEISSENTTETEEPTTDITTEEPETEAQPDETDFSEDQAREAIMGDNSPEVEEPVADDAGKLNQKTGKYYVILGAFGEDAKAQELRQKLASEGRSAYLIPNTSKGLVRVGVGAYDTKQAAIDAAADLSQGWVMKW
ncbi:MAG: SPOR domain-containing protein [Bacteroidota bacterium]